MMISQNEIYLLMYKKEPPKEMVALSSQCVNCFSSTVPSILLNSIKNPA